MQKETPIISEDLINLLVCPTKGVSLKLNEEKNALVNEKFDVSYPIVDGIPFFVNVSD